MPNPSVAGSKPKTKFLITLEEAVSNAGIIIHIKQELPVYLGLGFEGKLYIPFMGTLALESEQKGRSIFVIKHRGGRNISIIETLTKECLFSGTLADGNSVEVIANLDLDS